MKPKEHTASPRIFPCKISASQIHWCESRTEKSVGEEITFLGSWWLQKRGKCLHFTVLPSHCDQLFHIKAKCIPQDSSHQLCSSQWDCEHDPRGCWVGWLRKNGICFGTKIPSIHMGRTCLLAHSAKPSISLFLYFYLHPFSSSISIHFLYFHCHLAQSCWEGRRQ